MESLDMVTFWYIPLLQKFRFQVIGKHSTSELSV
jgi:hypothetical protein